MNELSIDIKKQISTLQWDLSRIHDMDLKLVKEKKIATLKNELQSLPGA